MNHQKDREVDWLELPDHIVSVIAIKLINIKDYIHFGAVCHPWRSVFIENKHHLPRQPPLLMLGTELNSNVGQIHSFYSLVEKKVIQFQVPVPVPHNMKCNCSSQGWLLTVSNNKDSEITLRNPFLSLNNVIDLPSAINNKDREITHRNPFLSLNNVIIDPSAPFLKPRVDVGYVWKVVFSANPRSNSNYVAMAIIKGGFRRIGYFKSGDNVWTVLAKAIASEIFDVLYYGDQFYFVDMNGIVFSCDLNHPDHPSVVEVAPSPESPPAMRRYLVESSGELLQVCRFTGFEFDSDPKYEGIIIGNLIIDYFNNGFDVFKLDAVAHQWIKMNTLHGRMLFLGHNSSYSLLASDFPGCKPNSVYFTDDYYQLFKEDYGLGPQDMGVFNLEDGSHEPHYRTDSKKNIPPHIWIEPTL